ncbi:MAG: hypothetical protein WBD23_00700 [Candidatus Acidiferrales bacterium]
MVTEKIPGTLFATRDIARAGVFSRFQIESWAHNALSFAEGAAIR